GAHYHVAPASGTPAVVYPMIAATRPLGLRPFDVVSTRPRIPDVYRAVQLFGVLASDEDGQFAARPRVRFDVFGDPANAVELLPIGLIRHINKRDGARQMRFQKRHPFVGFPPRAFTLVEISPRPIKRRRDDHVADALSRALVAIGFSEIRAAKSPHRV